MASSKPAIWNEKLELPGHVRFMEGVGDLPMLNVISERSSAEIYLHGAHLTHFQRNNEPPLLFLSQVSQFSDDKPIRGGIPVILPWFGPREGQPMHGFARTSNWDLKEIVPAKNGAIALRFRLEADETAGFPPLAADYLVTVSDTLELQLTVTNGSKDKELSFEECLHTYFRVGDIGATGITGLKGVNYVDKVDGFAQKTETADAIKISSEVDRVYLDTTGPIELHDTRLKRKIVIAKQNSASTVVWNPWSAKAQQMSDFGDDEYLHMVCLEAGNVGKNKITLAPGKSSSFSVTLSTASLV
jgi:glucose-6-phosphate 1-epimerase